MNIKELFELGKSQGYVTYLDFKSCLPAEIIDQEQIEDIVCMLKDMGVEVRMERAKVISLLLHRKDE